MTSTYEALCEAGDMLHEQWGMKARAAYVERMARADVHLAPWDTLTELEKGAWIVAAIAVVQASREDLGGRRG